LLIREDCVDASLNDGTLHGLLSELPAESILVMEDMWVAGAEA